MATPKKKKKRKGSTRKGKITISQKAQIIQKNDKIKVQQPDTLRKAPTKTTLPTNGITFKVKVRKK